MKENDYKSKKIWEYTKEEYENIKKYFIYKYNYVPLTYSLPYEYWKFSIKYLNLEYHNIVVKYLTQKNQKQDKITIDDVKKVLYEIVQQKDDRELEKNIEKLQADE